MKNKEGPFRDSGLCPERLGGWGRATMPWEDTRTDTGAQEAGFQSGSSSLTVLYLSR